MQSYIVPGAQTLDGMIENPDCKMLCVLVWHGEPEPADKISSKLIRELLRQMGTTQG